MAIGVLGIVQAVVSTFTGIKWGWNKLLGWATRLDVATPNSSDEVIVFGLPGTCV